MSLVIAALIGASMVHAQEDALEEPPGKPTRASLMEVNFRYRYMAVPDSVLDIWYFDEDDPGANPYKRPQGRAYTVGLEYVLKPKPVNWIFYFEYMGSLMEEGYWDDVEDGEIDHEDGEWIKPEGFGGIILGANGGREVDVTSPDKDVWLSIMLGGGLGIVFLQGELQEWNPGGDEANDPANCPELSTSPAYVRKDVCDPDGVKRIPGVLPIIDMSASLKINFAERAHIRLEGGLHDMLFVGTAVGAVF
jgi:hypothetical protein